MLKTSILDIRFNSVCYRPAFVSFNLYVLFGNSFSENIILIQVHLQIFLAAITLVVDYHLTLWYALAFLGMPC